MRILLSFILTFFACQILMAQAPFKIGMIIEGNPGRNIPFEQQVKEEVSALLDSRMEVSYDTHYTGFDGLKTKQEIDKMMLTDVDVVLALGFIPSNELAKRSNHPKPSIAGIILDQALQQMPPSLEGTSGITNLSYILSPFDVKRDLEVFKSIYDYQKLGIIIDDNTLKSFPLISQFFDRVEGAHELIVATGDLTKDIQAIPDDVDAVYLMPLNNYAGNELPALFKSLTAKKLPAFSLVGRPYTESGGLASLAPSDFMPIYARRIAINILKISEGKNPANFPISIDGMSEDFVINMSAARALGIYPDFDVLNDATLLKLDEIESSRKMNIQSAVFDALQSNLDYQFVNKNIEIAEQDIKKAKSNLYPQLDANASFAIIDQNLVLPDGSDLQPVNYSAGGNITQLVYSEPVYANIAIQKLLKQQNEAAVDQTALDIILSTSQTYLAYLQTKSLVRISNQNVNVTKQNLSISKSKNKLGYTSKSDVYRLESQLAQNNIDLNSAVAQMRQAGYALNQILNKPQSEDFEVEDVSLDSDIIPTSNKNLEEIINNQRDFNLFMDFMVGEARRNLPELEQIELAIAAQERLLTSNKRSIYMPQLGLSGSYSKPFVSYNLPDDLKLTESPTWNVGASLALPIFQGGFRSASIEQNKVQIDQLRIQQENTRQKFELSLRSNLENVSYSYSRLFLAQTQAKAGLENFKIVQDLYRQGQTNIITLIDAQNAYLQADLSAILAVYQYAGDFMAVERDTGQFYFLMNEADKKDWTERLRLSIVKK